MHTVSSRFQPPPRKLRQDLGNPANLRRSHRRLQAGKIPTKVLQDIPRQEPIRTKQVFVGCPTKTCLESLVLHHFRPKIGGHLSALMH
jgi:hypothetical protein